MLHVFVSGGVFFMTVLTLFLIATLLAAWKAPAWVKEIGIMALVFSVFATLLGFVQIFDAVQSAGSVELPVLCGGLKITSITLLYGLAVYFVSLMVRIIQKPRI